MINPNTIYRVTGRYMDGQKIVGYHLVGEDGSQAQETKDRVIYLIGKGLISNMRIQIGSDKEIIIRGKGINLNNLPVFDSGKNQFRHNGVSQQAANTNVSTTKSSVSDANPMGQYEIVKRIMMKNKCLGYEVQDRSGHVSRKKREEVIKLATQKLLSNAVAQRYTKPEDGSVAIILRGVGCDLAKLPILIVDDNGKIVDPLTDKSSVTIRGAYMKHSGMLRDTESNTHTNFKCGDFIICGINGKISIKSKEQIAQEYKQDTSTNIAVCDDYLTSIGSYYIEIFGSKTVQVTPAMIKKWTILKPVA